MEGDARGRDRVAEAPQRGGEPDVGVVAGELGPPAEVAPALDAVDFVVAVGTVFGGEHLARVRVEAEVEAVAQAQRPDAVVVAGRRIAVVVKRVIGRRAPIRLVDAQNLPQRRVEPRRQARVVVLAERDVQVAVGAEVQVAAVVERRAGGVGLVQQDGGFDAESVEFAQPHDAMPGGVGAGV